MNLLLPLLLATAAPAAECPDEPQVRYDGRTFTATFCAPQVGWAGATLRRASDDFHHDLPAVRVKEAGTQVTVTGRVGAGFVQYVVGVWEEKDPCTSGRHGCEAYGYQLDLPTWSYPRYAYNAGRLHAFASLVPDRVRVMEAGGGAELTRRVLEHLGAQHNALDGGRAANPRTEIQILYRAAWDRGRAWQLAADLRQAELGYHWTVRHWAEAPDAFVVTVGGE